MKDHIENLIAESKNNGEELAQSEVQLKEKFEAKWKEWKNELSSGTKAKFTTAEEMYAIAEKTLQSLFKAQHEIIMQELRNISLQAREVTLTFTIDESKHLKSLRWFSTIGLTGIQPEDIIKANNRTKKFLNKVKEFYSKIDCQNFSESLIVGPLQELNASITSFNKKRKK